MPPDLRPAAARLGALVAGGAPRCAHQPDAVPGHTRVADLLDHVGGLAVGVHRRRHEGER